MIAASAALTATPGFAVPRYDGLWSVSIVTKKGDCVASYRYPMRIANGFLANGGAIALTVSGKVAPSGAVIVKVSSGTTSAIGSGRLAANAGQRLLARRFLLGLVDGGAAEFVRPLRCNVMAGLVPAIHVFTAPRAQTPFTPRRHPPRRRSRLVLRREFSRR